ncbi:MAG: hypothetical protein NT066_02135 [Candidatus Omnitrophica bacterium]|nr:hypothetical protein [Candidatus Omnitrophota bacterium]
MKGFTIIETLIVALTTGILMTGLFYALNTGESSRSFNEAQIEVQSEVRRAVDWIAKDVRQAYSRNIGSNSTDPSSTHIKFQKVIGYNTTSNSTVLSNNFIEYTYDPDLKTITRIDSGNSLNWTFRNIIQPPFYTNNNVSNIVIDPLSSGLDSPMVQTGNLVINITGEKPVKSGLNATYTLTEEVKIRNE